MNRYAIILAAGKGTRMKSDLPKVMHPIKGLPMVEHVVSTVEHIGVKKPTVIVGYQKEIIMSHLKDRVHYEIQSEQKGTAHAVLQAYETMYRKKGTTIILNGDVPMLQKETLLNLIQTHEEKKALATVLTAIHPDPYGYGRIVRAENKTVLRIVEEKDANEKEKQIQEINTGIFCFDNEVLFKYLPHVKNENAQQEFYLTDMIDLLQLQQNYRGHVHAYTTTALHEIRGVNDPQQLKELEELYF